MNPLLPWLAGTLLFVVGLVLLIGGTLSLWPAIAIILLGAMLESIGFVLWLRSRRPPR